MSAPRTGPGGGAGGSGRLVVAVLVALSAIVGLVRSSRSRSMPESPEPVLDRPEPMPDGPEPGRVAPRRRQDRSEPGEARNGPDGDTAPGDENAGSPDVAAGIAGYLFGLLLAAALTVASFTIARTGLVWGPGVAVALVVFAIAQMGVHLFFFLHITTDPDSTNNVLALAFGTLIVFLVIAGSLWIMANLNANMMPMDEIMRMQR